MPVLQLLPQQQEQPLLPVLTQRQPLLLRREPLRQLPRVPVLQLLPQQQEQPRITSYNVCYTKLLRLLRFGSTSMTAYADLLRFLCQKELYFTGMS